MKNIFILLIPVAFLGCIRSSSNQLLGRWNIGDTKMYSFDSTIHAIAEENEEEDQTIYQRFFLDNKLILRKDNSFDLVLFKNYQHGNWSYTDSTKTLRFFGMNSNPGFNCKVDSVNSNLLQLRFDSVAIHSILTIQDTGAAYRSFTQQAEYVLTFYVDSS